ncbi:MAG: RNA polymerase sigma factor [Candidatus Paceibacterota bacterium]
MKENIADEFKKIYENQSDAIFRFCLIRVSNREQALDITQDTFLRLWKNMLEEKDILNNRAFLFTIAHHLVIDWYRKKKSISLDKMIDNEKNSFDLLDEKTINNIEVSAEGRYLLNKINDLSITYKDPVYLRFVEDLTPQEIADILNISANAASVRINRGLEELREKTGYN